MSLVRANIDIDILKCHWSLLILIFILTNVNTRCFNCSIQSLPLLGKGLHSSNLPIQFQHAILQLLNAKLASCGKGPSFFKSANSIPTRDASTAQCKACFILQIYQFNFNMRCFNYSIQSLLLVKKDLHSSSLPIQFQHAMLQLLNAKLASYKKGPSFFKSAN